MRRATPLDRRHGLNAKVVLKVLKYRALVEGGFKSEYSTLMPLKTMARVATWVKLIPVILLNSSWLCSRRSRKFNAVR